MYEWDRDKDRANRARHGVSFSAAEGFDWSEAFETLDEREDYGEDRWIALGPIKGNLHVRVYTPRGDTKRLISLRRATKKETAGYAKAKAQNN